MFKKIQETFLISCIWDYLRAFIKLLELCFSAVENLQNLLVSGVKETSLQTEGNQSPGLSMLPRRADTFGGYDSTPKILPKSERHVKLE